MSFGSLLVSGPRLAKIGYMCLAFVPAGGQTWGILRPESVVEFECQSCYFMLFHVISTQRLQSSSTENYIAIDCLASA
jgi:hypothetical protein